MSRRDLGPILREERYVTVACLACSAIASTVPHTKPQALRIARRHAAEQSHSVRLYIDHYQDVEPPR